MAECLLDALGTAAPHATRGRVARHRQQRLLRDARHVRVATMSLRRLEPEAGVVTQVAVHLHCEHAPRRARP